MDARSHTQFAEALLARAGKSSLYIKWGNAPDIDTGFLHRWYRHRISVIEKTFSEYDIIKDGSPANIDRDAIALGIISHLYLDIFNGIVFPFGLWHPIYPEKTVINDVLEEIDDPKLLVEDSLRLTGEIPWLDEFYSGTKELMATFASNWNTCEEAIAAMVYRLSLYAAGGQTDKAFEMQVSLYKKAMKDVAAFTGNSVYTDKWDKVFLNTAATNQPCERFEKNYALHIRIAMEA